MTYPAEVMRVAITWAPDTTEWPGEVAVNTFWLQHHHFTGYSFDWGDATQYAAEQIDDKLGSHWADVSPYFAPGYRPAHIKTAQIDPLGHAVVEGQTDVTGTLYGTGTGSKVMPPEVSICLNLYGYDEGAFTTQKARKRGRIYWPYISPDCLDAKGMIDPTVLNDFPDAWAVFFNDIQGMHTDGSSLPGDHDYWNLVAVSSQGTGLATQVVRLGMDNHFDSQRRRQHQTPATTSSAAISH